MSKTSHGTVSSYIIGFVLSLVFTAIPYYMVVNKSATGNLLVGTILGFAVLQMLVQVLFFLHLGRGPKPLYNVAFFVSTVGIILVVVGGSMFIMSHLRYNMIPTDTTKKLAQDEAIYQINGEKTGACQGVYANHLVTIKDGRTSPSYTQTQLCDTLTFINQDNQARTIMFGSHSHPTSYAGEDELQARKGHGKTITLNQSGTYQFFDHMDPQVAGKFTVKP